MKLGIAGFGFVGQAVYSAVKHEMVHCIYDPPKGYNDYNKLISCTHIFCCLPSPQSKSGTQDFSTYKIFLDKLVTSKYTGTLIIKSTVLYSNISSYFGHLNIVMNPEFLNQNSAFEDFKNQHVIILGGPIDKCMDVENLYKYNFVFNTVPEFLFCTAEQAVQVKYFHNTYHAYKALFWNYVLEQTANHRKVFSMYSKITGNTFEMQNVCADGKPGFGGSCFPKDVAAINGEQPHELTEFMIKYNKRLRNTDKKK